jgi:hypothetical protein
VKGSDAEPGVAVVVPSTLGAAIEKSSVTVCADVAPASTSVCAPAGRLAGTVNA